MAGDKLSAQDLIDKVREFNSIAEKGNCSSRIRWDKVNRESKTEYALFLGSLDQFSHGTYQCKCCEGTLKECLLAAHSMVQLISFECKVF